MIELRDKSVLEPVDKHFRRQDHQDWLIDRSLSGVRRSLKERITNRKNGSDYVSSADESERFECYRKSKRGVGREVQLCRAEFDEVAQRNRNEHQSKLETLDDV